MKVMAKDHYQVRFDQNRGTAEFWANDTTDLSEQIYYHIAAQAPELVQSPDFIIELDFKRLEGSVNKGQYAMFKIERLDP